MRGELTTTEINIAEKKLLLVIQQETWNDIGKILSLSLFLHEDGLLRLKTKIRNSDDIFAFPCPILLSAAKHLVVQVSIFYQHKKNSHAGVQLLMNILREEYWIQGGRRTIRAVISKCVV